MAKTVMTPEREARALDMARQGYSLPDTARALGVPKPTLWNWAHRGREVVFVAAYNPRPSREILLARQMLAEAPLTPEQRRRARDTLLWSLTKRPGRPCDKAAALAKLEAC